MQNVTKLFLLTLGLGVLAGRTAQAQVGIGTGTVAPRTMLDVNGALSVAETTVAADNNSAILPTSYGLVRLTGSPTATVALTTATTPAPVPGQHLLVVNPTAQLATLAGQNIAAGQALAFIYSNGGWVATAGGPSFYSADGTLTGSRTVAMGANNLLFNTTTGYVGLNGNNTGVYRVELTNFNSGNGANTRLGLNNDAGSAFLFLNSSTRTADGGANGLTLRNNVGDLNLQSKGNVGLNIAATTGTVTISSLAGTGARSVLADANGVLSAVTPTAANTPNIYTADGNLTSGRTLTMGANNLTFSSNTGRTILSGTGNTAQGIDLATSSNGNNAHARLALLNDVGYAFLYLNSSGRSADGGVNTLTLRNDVGDLRLQSKGAVGLNVAATTGNVGIGTATPAYPLDVTTIGGSLAGNYAYYALGNNAINTGAATNTGSVSIRASGRIAAAEFNAFSDARLKRITGFSDSKSDLGLLKRIEITDYQMKDKAQYGDRAFKKVIAQQVEKVYPLAVNKGTGFVPSIYSTSTVVPAAAGQSVVTLVAPHHLQVGDKVKLMGEKNGTVETMVLAVSSPRSFAVALPQAETRLFVFGPEVKDLRTVDYEAIAMLNVSATQELAKQVAALQAANAQLTAANAHLKASLDEKATASTLSEMQAALQVLRAEVQSLKGTGITASAK
ncbi:MAG: tail fiber domain-containing protein [Hymenobacter sp.]|nr:MAG: tail fiber domain-containing protein [Hymenobacter sp.]